MGIRLYLVGADRAEEEEIDEADQAPSDTEVLEQTRRDCGNWLREVRSLRHGGHHGHSWTGTWHKLSQPERQRDPW